MSWFPLVTGVVAMAERIVAGLVPPVGNVSRPNGPLRGDGSGLPVPEVTTRRELPVTYGIARVDDSGRIADRPVLQALGWSPGQQLFIRVISGTIILQPDPAGIHRLPGRPYVLLPAAARTRCRIQVGDRVLLTADPGRDALLIDTMAALHEALTARHAAVRGGGAP
jgi:bifunctional DNA-binding transcriptional regulator/antitoxin component of YhaV-PrlF toxin-antitoxin module